MRKLFLALLLICPFAWGQDERISQMPAANLPLAGTELVPLVQFGYTSGTCNFVFFNPVTGGCNVMTPISNFPSGGGGGGGPITITVPSFLSVTPATLTPPGTFAFSYSGTPLPVAVGGSGSTSPSLVAGTGIGITGSWPDQLVSYTGGAGLTSVGLSMPSVFTVTGSPLTSNGTLSVAYSGTPLPVLNGGSGLTAPALIAGPAIAITGSWPDQTIAGSEPLNAQTGTTYTIASSDAGKFLTFHSVGSVAVAIPQAGTTGFGTAFAFDTENTGTGTVTFTPTVSSINGGSTITEAANTGCEIYSDGTNYQVLACTAVAPTGGGGGSSANPSATIGLSGVNGTATTFMTSDSAPPLSQGIVPTWTGIHTFSATPVFNAGLTDAGTTNINNNNNATTNIGTGTTTSAVTLGNPANTVTFDGPVAFSQGTTISAASWTTAGIGLDIGAATFNDSTGSGTIATEAAYAFGSPTISRTTAGTITSVVNAYFAAPVAGTGTTAGTLYAIYSNGNIGTTGNLNASGLTLIGNVVLGNSSQLIWGPVVRAEITSPATNTLQWGAANSATPANYTVQGQGSRGGTDTNVAGANVIMGSGDGTGNAAGATYTIQTPHATTSGTTQQTMNNQIVVGDNTVGMPNLASSSAATTGTVCWTTSTGNLTVDTTLACLSSLGLWKKDIIGLDVGLFKLLQLYPVSYELKPEFNPQHLGRQIGFLAEDVEKVDKRLVGYGGDGKLRGVRYMQMTALITQGVQALTYLFLGGFLALAAYVIFLHREIRVLKQRSA